MGREIKRVALDFNWPLNKVWRGFLCPYTGSECPKCEGHGSSPEAEKLKNRWYGFDRLPRWVDLGNGRRYNAEAWCYNLEQEDVDALLKEVRLWDFTREPINEEQRKIVQEKIAAGGNSWLPFDNGYKPSAEEVNQWSRTGFGHDSINEWIVVRARCEKLGIPVDCSMCQGEGTLWESPEIEKLAEDWEPIEPPTGEGWQMWETVSEGSPITPVFATDSELVDYMVNGDAWDHKWTRQQAEAMVAEGFAMSRMAVGGKFMRAEEAVEYSHNERIKKGIK